MQPLTPTTRTREIPAIATGPLAVTAVLLVAGLLAVSTRYGFFRDELYFLACGRRLAWGYPDQGVLTPLIARLADVVAPGSLLALRVPAALLAAATSVLAGLTARELGGGRFGQTLAAATVAVGTLTLTTGHILSTSTVDLTVWTAIGWLTTRMLRTRDARLWPALGLVCGVGLQNKQLPIVLAFAVLVAFGCDPTSRRLLASPWLLAGAVVAAAIWAPELWWQAQHGWPQAELARQIRAEYGVLGERIGFLAIQLVIFSAGAFVLLVAGVRRLLRDPSWRSFRPLVWGELVVLLVFIVTAGQVYYPAGAYVPLVAAGSVAVQDRERRRRYAVTVAWTSLLLLPAALPVLPLSALAGSPWNGLGEGLRESAGWPELVDQVAAAYRSIPESERPRAVVYAGNYGEAGAVDELGPSRGLPAAVSGHNGYADWGPPPEGMTGPVVVVYEGPQPDSVFAGCAPGRRVQGPVSNEERDYASITVCQAPSGGWAAAWKELRFLSS